MHLSTEPDVADAVPAPQSSQVAVVVLPNLPAWHSVLQTSVPSSNWLVAPHLMQLVLPSSGCTWPGSQAGHLSTEPASADAVPAPQSSQVAVSVLPNLPATHWLLQISVPSSNWLVSAHGMQLIWPVSGCTYPSLQTGHASTAPGLPEAVPAEHGSQVLVLVLPKKPAAHCVVQTSVPSSNVVVVVPVASHFTALTYS